MSRLAFLFVLAAAASAQQADYRVEAPLADRPIDRIIERVDAERDRWIGERDYEAINAKLKEISKHIKEGDADFPPLAEAVARFESIQLCELKIVGSSRASEDAQLADIRVRVELGGRTSDGALLSLLGPMQMIWKLEAREWRLASASVGELREVSAPRPYFTEITGDVFGSIDSFRHQLEPDVDYWRTHMDQALGISVYGHQGLSVGDANGDGLDDLYIAQPGGLPNRLYLGRGDGTFADGTRAAGLDVLDDTSMSLFADIDNDGDQDLILIGAEPLLFLNDGSGRFAFRENSGLKPPPERAAMFTSAALADYDLDGDLDLYVCSYDFWQAGSEYDAPTPYYDASNGPANLLFRNDGDGTFTEVTRAAGLDENNNRFSFAAGWGDYDDDGDPDLYVANDFGRNNLYRNNGDGTFSDVAAEAGVEDLGAGMAVAWGDYDGDGRLDLHVSNMWSSAGQRLTFNSQFQGVAESPEVRAQYQRQARGNSLFRNNGDGTFSDVAEAAGVTMGRWAWSTDFVDLNSDGRPDLFVQNGYITGARLDDL